MAYLYRYLTATFEWEENARYLVKTAQNPFAHDFLDLGTGPGYIAHELSNLYGAARVIGLDCAFKMVKIASAKKHQRGFFIQADSEYAPFRNNTLDVITARSVLWLNENPEKILSEVKRILKEKGRFILLEPFAEGRLIPALRKAKHLRVGLAHFGLVIMTKLLGCYREEEWKSILTEHGFSISHCEKVLDNLAILLISEKK